MTMQHVGRNNHDCPRANRAICKYIGSQRDPADSRDRRIKANSFFDHGAGNDKAFTEVINRSR
jgi:hypothetical protein